MYILILTLIFNDRFREKHHILLPEKRRDVFKPTDFVEYDTEIINIKDNEEFYGYLFGGQLYRLENPIIYIVSDDFEVMKSKNFKIWDFMSLSHEIKNEEDVLRFNQALIDEGFGYSVQMIDTRIIYLSAKENLRYFRNYIIQLSGIYILFLVAFSYSITQIYLEDNRKDIAVKYLNGTSYIKRYMYLYMSHLIAGIIMLYILNDSSFATLGFIAAIIIVNILITMYLTKKDMNKDTIKSIKGE